MRKHTADGRFTFYGALYYLHRDYLRAPRTRYAWRHYPGDLAGYVKDSWRYWT